MSNTQTLLKQGTPVKVGNFEGVIVRHYDDTIYEIRLPGGVVVTSEFIESDDKPQAAKPEDFGTTGLIDYVLKGEFKGSWQRWQKARGIIRSRYGAHGVRRFCLAVDRIVHDGTYSNHFITRINAYTGIR